MNLGPSNFTCPDPLFLRICAGWEVVDLLDPPPSHMISIVDLDVDGSEFRPEIIDWENHLVLEFVDVDITGLQGAPTKTHIERLIDWLKEIESQRVAGLLVHCRAGVSRSTAGAYIALCILEPSLSAEERMAKVVESATREFIWPNQLVVDLADEILGAEGALEAPVRKWKIDQTAF